MNTNLDFLENINKFLSLKCEKDSAGDKIFENLQNFVHFEKAGVFYINADRLKPVYLFNLSESKTFENDIQSLGKYILKEALLVNGCVFGLLVLASDKPYSNDEKDVFKTCAVIVSNIIKELELTDIMQMQVKALQEGIKEINGFNKLIKEQNKKILAADKVKNNFLSNVSHELRSPLNSIIGFSDMLLTRAFGNLNEKQSEYINDINIAGIHLLGMVNEILDISKIEAHAVKLNLSEFSLYRCVNEVMNILRPLYLKKNISVENSVAENLVINADYQKLQQIFFNLISNAIKFTENEGFIKIYASASEKYVTVCIEDNGAGIDKKNHARIFKKFEQVNSEKSGNTNSTGLGLTIVKELVKLHKGKISVESELNRGSTFRIKLPL